MPAVAGRSAPLSFIGLAVLALAGIALLVLAALRWSLIGWTGWAWLAGFVAMNLDPRTAREANARKPHRRSA